MTYKSLFTVVLVRLLFGVVSAQTESQYKHAQYFEHYQGTKTCMECHQKEAGNLLSLAALPVARISSEHHQCRPPESVQSVLCHSIFLRCALCQSSHDLKSLTLME